MRIALIAFHFAEYAYRLASELCHDHTVLLVMHRENAVNELGDTIHERMPENMRMVLFERRGPKDPLFILNVFRIFHILCHFRPDVIHYQESLNYAFSIARAILSGSTPFVLTIHDHIPHSGVKETELMSRHRVFLRRRCDAAIVHGVKIRNECEDIMPWLKGRVFSVPHGVLGDPGEDTGEGWEKGTVLFFGRIEEYKGLAFLIEAARILEKRSVPFRAIIAGRGEELERLRADVLSLKSFEVIDRYIEKEEIRALFERANLVVLPYTDATQSGVIALAMQYGRPVIATDVGSIGEVVKNGSNGLVIPPRNAEALADAMQKLLVDDRLAEEMGRNARRTAEDDLSWKAIARKTIDVYNVAMTRSKDR